MTTYEKIIEVAESLESDLIATRRDFHKHAETGWFEMRTSSLIARRLTDLGYEVLVGENVCDKDARMGVPSEEKLAAHYEKAAAWGADEEFLPATRGGMTGVIGILRCGEGPTVRCVLTSMLWALSSRKMLTICPIKRVLPPLTPALCMPAVTTVTAPSAWVLPRC